MEATSLLTLILLSSVGARKIPAIMDEPSGELQIIGENLFSYTETVPEGEFFFKDPVEDAVRADLEPTSNKEVNKDEKSEKQNHKVAGMDIAEPKDVSTKTKVDENQQSDKITAPLNPAEVTNEDEDTTNKTFEDRNGAIGGDLCPDGVRVGSACWPRDNRK